MSHRILLIDDEDDILEFIRYNLTKAGYEVYTARNGAEGLQQAAAHRPHLILLDVMMPTMDGIETCRALVEIYECLVMLVQRLGCREIKAIWKRALARFAHSGHLMSSDDFMLIEE